MTLPSYPCLNAAVDRDCPQTPTYPARECTSGGSWWASRYTGKPWPTGWGNADNWPAAARAARFNVTIQPSANSIMCIPPNTNGAGPKGHIAYVIGLAGPMAQVWEMNFLIEYGFDYRMARTANCEYIHLLAPPPPSPKPPPNSPTPHPVSQEDDDAMYLFNAGAPGIWALYWGKYFHVTPDDLAAFEAIALKPIQTIGAAGHAVLLATYPS